MQWTVDVEFDKAKIGVHRIFEPGVGVAVGVLMISDDGIRLGNKYPNGGVASARISDATFFFTDKCLICHDVV